MTTSNKISEDQFKHLRTYISKLSREVEKCGTSKAYLAGVIMAGALLEAVLLSFATIYEDEVEKARKRLNKKCKRKLGSDPLHWGLQDLLYISFEAGWIPFNNATDPKDREIGDWALNYVKELRNWVHPGKKIKKYTRMRMTEKRFRTALDIVYKVRDLLLEKLEKDVLETYGNELGEQDG